MPPTCPSSRVQSHYPRTTPPSSFWQSCGGFSKAIVRIFSKLFFLPPILFQSCRLESTHVSSSLPPLSRIGILRFQPGTAHPVHSTAFHCVGKYLVSHQCFVSYQPPFFFLTTILLASCPTLTLALSFFTNYVLSCPSTALIPAHHPRP